MFGLTLFSIDAIITCMAITGDNIGEEFRDDDRPQVGLPSKVVKQLTKLNAVKATIGVFETIGFIGLSIVLAIYF